MNTVGKNISKKSIKNNVLVTVSPSSSNEYIQVTNWQEYRVVTPEEYLTVKTNEDNKKTTVEVSTPKVKSYLNSADFSILGHY